MGHDYGVRRLGILNVDIVNSKFIFLWSFLLLFWPVLVEVWVLAL